MWISSDLRQALTKLTSKQAEGVRRIVRAELDGEPISNLLKGPDKICAYKTYYGGGKSRGWIHNPAFDAALTLARRDYRAWLMEHGTDEAMFILADAAPDAAQSLRQRVRGDAQALSVLETALNADEKELRIKAAQRLGATGLPQVVPALQAAFEREKHHDVRLALVEALGTVASGSGRDMGAASNVLDRADVKTASKSQQAVSLPGFEQALSRAYGSDETDGKPDPDPA